MKCTRQLPRKGSIKDSKGHETMPSKGHETMPCSLFFGIRTCKSKAMRAGLYKTPP